MVHAMRDEEEPLGRLSVFYYGVGHMLNDITSACWFTYLLIFLTDIGLSPRDAAIVMLSGQVADGFTTIFAGELIDRFGHFKIWHAAGSILVAISFSSVFGGCIPCDILGSNSSTMQTFGYSMFAAIFNVGWAVTQVSHMSMVNCITLDSSSRVVLASCRNAFTMVANLGLYAVALAVFHFTISVTKLDIEDQYRWIAYVSIFIGCCFVGVFLIGTKEPSVPGARFSFLLDEELKEAAASDEVRVAIVDKISRERIGREIDLMFLDKHPVQAVTYICSLQLFGVVFTLPAKSEPAVLEGCDRLCVASMDAAWNLLELIGYTTFNDEQRRLYLYSTFFIPLRKVVYSDKKGKKIPVANYIFRNSLKLKNSDAETVISLHSASERFISLIDSLAGTENVEAGNGRDKLDAPRLRILAGLLLREIKSLWRVALLISTLLYPIDFDGAEVSPDKQIERRNLFTTVETAIMKLGLENVWEMKPLVNGKEIMSILQLKTGGPQVRELQQRSLEWQLADPSRTSEQCIDWMRESFSKLPQLE